MGKRENEMKAIQGLLDKLTNDFTLPRMKGMDNKPKVEIEIKTEDSDRESYIPGLSEMIDKGDLPSPDEDPKKIISMTRASFSKPKEIKKEQLKPMKKGK